MEQLVLHQTPVETLVSLVAEKVLAGLSSLKAAAQDQPAKTDDGDELFTVKQTAKLLNISLPTLRALTYSGKLTAFRLGNRVYYKKADIYTALKEIRVSSTAA